MVENEKKSGIPSTITWEGSRAVEAKGTKAPLSIRFEFNSELMDRLTEDERKGIENLLLLFGSTLGMAVGYNDTLSETQLELSAVVAKIGKTCIEIGDALQKEFSINNLRDAAHDA